jgi:Rod binding domain-containing protein
MSDVAGVSHAAPASPERSPARPELVRQAASEFEALLIAQMLRSARSASSLTSLDGEDSGSKDAVTEFAEQQLSDTLASAGGLGLANLVATGLGGAAAPAATPQLRTYDS